MAVQQQNTAAFVESFAALKRRQPAWLADRRRLAIERFSLLGIPTTHDEEYKYTSLKAISGQTWTPSAAVSVEAPSVDYAGEEAARIVFVDGRFLGAAGDASLAAKLTSRLGGVEGHLTRYADFESHALTALNTAFFTDGADVVIPEYDNNDTHIHLLMHST